MSYGIPEQNLYLTFSIIPPRKLLTLWLNQLACSIEILLSVNQDGCGFNNMLPRTMALERRYYRGRCKSKVMHVDTTQGSCGSRHSLP